MKIVDLHQDIQTYFYYPQLLDYKYSPSIDGFKKWKEDRHGDVESYIKAGVRIIVTSVFPYEADLVPTGMAKVQKSIEWYNTLAQMIPAFKIVHDKQDLESVASKDQIGLVLHMEGLGGVNKPEDIEVLKNLGIRSVGLSWNENNCLCSTCAESEDVGLKSQGKDVVDAIIDNNLMLDLTHSSSKTQDTILGNYEYDRVMFSHGGMWDAYEFEQNIRSEVIKELANRKGVVGLAFLDLMINGENNSTADDFMDHMEKASKYAGFIALGTDFFGFEYNRGLKEITRINECDKLFERIEKEYGKDFTEKFAHKNAQKFLRRCL